MKEEKYAEDCRRGGSGLTAYSGRSTRPKFIVHVHGFVVHEFIVHIEHSSMDEYAVFSNQFGGKPCSLILLNTDILARP
jgi:hypothetical protein